jgi:hypothetical protein
MKTINVNVSDEAFEMFEKIIQNDLSDINVQKMFNQLTINTNNQISNIDYIIKQTKKK